MEHDQAAVSAPMRVLLEERGRLLAYINVIVRDLAAAEDVLQETLVLGLRQAFIDTDHARAWIRVTARNLALNEYRRRQRRGARLSDEVLDQLEAAWSDESDLASHGERLAALRICCEGLSAAALRLIDLRFHQGLDGAAIAAAIGRPVNTVYVGLSRIYRRLAACIHGRLDRP